MGKYCNPLVQDNGLNYIKNNCNAMHLCSGQPVSRADVLTRSKGTVVMASGDFTLAAGDVSGRKCTVAAKSGTFSAGGANVDHVALISGTELVYVTTTDSQAPNAGNPWDLSAWKVELRDPTP